MSACYADVSGCCVLVTPRHRPQEAAEHDRNCPPQHPTEGFAPSTLATTRGVGLLLVNLDPVSSPDGAPHDIQSLAKRADKSAPWCNGYPKGKCPLFWTPLINAGQTTQVQGMADTVIGETYPFVCSLHGRMQGTVQIQG